MAKHHKAHRAQSTVNPSRSWLSVLFFALITFAFVATLLAGYFGQRQLEADMRKWASWPATRGTPTYMRVVEQPMTKSSFKWARAKSYVVECLVTYSVSGKQYSVWANSYQGTNVSQFTQSAITCPTSSFSVHYDPQQPSTAHAFVVDPVQR